MAWFRLDDRGAFHRKIVMAGNAAVGAWARAGMWSSSEGTDGMIPKANALAIAPRSIWKKLEDAKAGGEHGLVELRPDGWQIHDFLVYNPSAAEVRAERDRVSKVRAEAGRRGGQRSGESRQSAPGQPLKAQARSFLNAAIKRGDVERQPCEVCNTLLHVEGHHSDYTRPLDVRWLCREHHQLEHQPKQVASPDTKQLASPVVAGALANRSPDPVPDPHSPGSPPGFSGFYDRPVLFVRDEAPPSRPLRPAIDAHEEPDWIAAYSMVVEEVLGRPWSFPQKTITGLRDAMKLAEKPNRVAWLRREVEAFVRAVLPRPELWSGFGPDGFLKWLNTGRPSVAAAPSPINAQPMGNAAPRREVDLRAVRAPIGEDPTNPNSRPVPIPEDLRRGRS